ncbi:hypothetical protein GCM10010466_39560 [Planomonospora alba]|uniref:YqaJ viral recombinase domain-containing protein n=1 Tax=Planomonospora alba TaxID=161354 RepID=A0ABP6NDM5_9ACTN
MTVLDIGTARLLGRWPDGSPEWHAARDNRIGGSTIAAILGISPWESQFSVWCRMAGLVDGDEQTAAQARGHYLEGGIRAWYADQHPQLQVRHGGTYVHADPARSWQLANPDGLVYDGDRLVRGAEFKTDADGSHWGRPGTDEVPLYYRTQVLWYMDVFGLPEWDLVVLDGRLNFRSYTVRYDADDAEWIRSRAESFMTALLWNEMPELDHHPATYETVRKLHPDIDKDEHLVLPDELAIEFIEAAKDVERATQREQAARAAVLDAMGNAYRAWWNGHKLARRQAKKGGTPYLMAEQYLTSIPTPTRPAAAVEPEGVAA